MELQTPCLLYFPIFLIEPFKSRTLNLELEVLIKANRRALGSDGDPFVECFLNFRKQFKRFKSYDLEILVFPTRIAPNRFYKNNLGENQATK